MSNRNQQANNVPVRSKVVFARLRVGGVQIILCANPW